jgi:hypothetical protein
MTVQRAIAIAFVAAFALTGSARAEIKTEWIEYTTAT